MVRALELAVDEVLGVLFGVGENLVGLVLVDPTGLDSTADPRFGRIDDRVDDDLDVDALFVAEASVGKNMVMKRWRPRARGRVSRILKPFSEIRIVVREREEVA